MKTLVYQGGGDLTFHDGTGARRRVERGVSFDVDDATATILLEDPAVSSADDIPRGNPEDRPAPTKAELRARADELGLTLPVRSTNDELTAAIAAEEARLADEAAAGQASSSGEGDGGGEAMPAGDPGASASGEAGTPPEAPGAITLGDLPDGAIVKG